MFRHKVKLTFRYVVTSIVLSCFLFALVWLILFGLVGFFSRPAPVLAAMIGAVLFRAL